jgi:hypothetical protein
MEITIKISDKIAAEARARGMSVEVYVQEIVARQTSEASAGNRRGSITSAIDQIFELRKGNRLDGLRTTDLIREGRKH